MRGDRLRSALARGSAWVDCDPVGARGRAAGCGDFSRFWARLIWSASATWTLGTGRPICKAGARFGYALIWVLLMSNLMAILLQTLAARLGVVTGHDLAQACRAEYSRGLNAVLWVLAEVAIAACDLAEILGTVIALKLLFGIPLLMGMHCRRHLTRS